EPPRVGFSGKSTGQAQQRFTAAMHDGYPFGGDEPGLDVRQIEWLGQVVVGAGLHAGQPVLGVVQRGQQDEVGVRSTVARSDAAAQLDAVHARHHPVADHDVGAARVVQIERFGAVGGATRGVAEVCDYVLDQRTNVRVVLRN